MTRDNSGRLLLSPSVLGTIIATCLAVGSGGAWALRANTVGAAATQAAAISAEEISGLKMQITLNMTTIARLEERDKSRSEQLTRIEGLLEKLNEKIDRLDRRRTTNYSADSSGKTASRSAGAGREPVS
jgi:hypothetical protein